MLEDMSDNRSQQPAAPQTIAPPAATGLEARFALLYDSDCGLCSQCVAWIVRWDRHHRLDAVPLQAPDAALLVPIEPGARQRSWHLISPNGELWSAGEVFAPLLRLLPCGSPLAALASAFPDATNTAYRFVVRHRDRLGRLTGSSCRTTP